MNNFFDFIYEHDRLFIVIDNNNKVWFAANDIATIFEYKAPQKMIEKIVPDKYKKQFQHINIKNKIYSKKYQKKSMFLDEVGLFRLSIKSKQQKAVKLQEWITDVVLPKLRMGGTFELENKVTLLEKKIKKITKVNKQLLSELDYIRNIKYNPDTNIMYILKIATSYRGKKTICYKLGITDNLKKRITVYKTGNTKINLINSFKLKNLKASIVEKCAKSVLRYKELKKNNEIYCTNIKNIYSILQSCISSAEQLIGICHGCKQKIDIAKMKVHKICFN